MKVKDVFTKELSLKAAKILDASDKQEYDWLANERRFKDMEGGEINRKATKEKVMKSYTEILVHEAEKLKTPFLKAWNKPTMPSKRTETHQISTKTPKMKNASKKEEMNLVKLLNGAVKSIQGNDN